MKTLSVPGGFGSGFGRLFGSRTQNPDKTPSVSPEPVRWPPWLGKTLATLALAGLALLGNVVHVPLFFGVDLLFGQIAALLALVWLGALPAVAISATGGLYTWLLWGHPYALVLFTLEIAFVAWHRRRHLTANREAPPLAISVALFWLFIGMPLALVVYHGLIQLPWTPTFLIALKQPLNSLLNAGIAGLILLLVSARGKKAGALRIAELAFTVLMLGLTLPTIAMITWDNADLKQDLEQDQARHMRLLGHLAAYRRMEQDPGFADQHCCHLNELDPRLTESFPPHSRPRVTLLAPADPVSKPTVTLEPTADPDLMLAIPRRNFHSTAARWRSAVYQLDIHTPVPTPDTRVRIEIDAAPVIDELQSRAIPLLSALLLLTLLAVWIACHISGWLSRSLVGLLNTTQALPAIIQAGMPPPNIPANRLIEIDSLAKAIGAMADSLARGFASLRSKQQRLTNITEGTHAGAWEWNLITGETRTDERMASMLGYELAEFSPGTARTWFDVIHPDDLQLIQTRIEQHLRGETDVYETEFRARRKDGQWIWLYSRGRVIEQDDTGAPRLLAGIDLDITERKSAEQTMRAERDLFSAGPVFTIAWGASANWPVLQVSSNVATILGYSPAEITAPAFRFAELIHPADLGPIGQEVSAHIAHHQDRFEQSYRLRLKDGSYRWFYDFSMISRNDAGEAELIRGYLFDQSQIKEAEAALAIEHQRLADIIDGASVGTWEWNVVTGELALNGRWVEIIGYDLEELTPTSFDTWRERVYPDDLDRCTQLLNAHFRGELAYYDCELRMRHKDGRWVWVQARGRLASWTEDGRPLLMRGTHQDIDERKRIETDLLSSKKRFEDIVNASADGIWELDCEGRYLYASDSEAKLIGCPVGELLGRTAFEFMPADEAQRVSGLFSGFIKQPARFRDLEVTRRRDDGNLITMQVTGIPILNTDGQLRGYRGIGRNITDQKRAEQALIKNQKLLRALIDTIPDAVWMKTPEGHYLICNPRFEAFTGFPEEDILGKTDHDLFSPDDAKAFHANDQAVIAAGQSRINEEIITYASDGHQEFLQTIKTPVYDKDKTLIGILGLGRDITQLKDAEQELKAHRDNLERLVMERTAELTEARAEAERLAEVKGEFLANMSHEIRTPMNAVLGLATLLNRQELPEEARQLARKIQSSGQSLLGIINDILDVSKIESGKIELEQTPFRLNEVLDNLATIMAGNAQDKTIELIILPPPCSDWSLQGDPLRLGQILINLTNNAIKFTDTGLVEVRIDTLSLDDTRLRLRFAVRDTGIGIDRETQDRLFQPFVQADASTRRRFGGSGLGLVIVRRLAELMGGRMGLDSTPGQGSTFWVELPFTVLVSSPRAEIARPPLQVLVLAEHPELREGLLKTVTALGWSALSVTEETAVLRHISQDAAHQGLNSALLIARATDQDGLTTAAAIRAGLPPAQCPLLFVLSSHRADEIPADSAADAVLTKPLTPLPLADAAALARRHRFGQPAPIAPAADQARRLVGLHLLVVDDNEINREVARGIFTDEGAQVSLTHDGQQALDWLIAQPKAADLVLMDIQMPVLDGLEATRVIRQHPELAALPVVALTAGAMPEQQAAARDAGVNGFLSKPFDIDDAVALIGSLTGRSAVATHSAAAADSDRPPADTDHPGLDLQAALAIWKNADRYRQFLRKFATKYGDSIKRIVANDPDDARRQAHAIKGSAGNLGLTEVAGRASALEQACRAGAAEESIRDAIAALEIALATALASIAQYAPAQDTPAVQRSSTRSHQPDRARIEPLLRQAYLACADFEPLLAETPLKALAEIMPADQLAPLREAVDNLDASTGAAAARALAAQLGILLENDG